MTSSELQLPASDFQINAFILILGGLYVLSLQLFVAFCQKYTNFSSHLLKILKILSYDVVAVVQWPSCVRLFGTPRTAARLASLSFTISQSLFKLMPIESVMLSNHLILCHPFPFGPQSFPASRSFPVGWLFASGGQSIGASALASVLPVNIQD